MNHQPLAKRSACDRYRAQKTRCPRTEDASGPCARCVRADAECVTGQPGRLGRPRKAFANPSSRLSGSDPLRSLGAQAPRKEVQAPAQSQHNPMSSIMSAAVDTPAPRSADGKDTELFWGPHTADSAFGAIGSSHPTDPAPWEVPDLFHGFLEGNVSRGSFSPFLDFEPTEDRLVRSALIDTAPECRGGDDRPRVGNLDSLYADDSRRPLAMVHAGPNSTSFSPLDDKISVIITSLKSFPWDRPGFVDRYAELVEEAENNPVSDALQCSEEFTKLLRSLNFGTSSTGDDKTEGSPGRLCHLSMATVLSILSTYMRIHELYDILFRNLCRSLSTILIGVITSMRIKSVVRIGTLPSMQDMPGLAYAQIVIFVIQVHIKALGLEMGR